MTGSIEHIADAAPQQPARGPHPLLRDAEVQELRGLLEVYERWERLFHNGDAGARVVRAEIAERAAYIRTEFGITTEGNLT